MRSTVSWSGPGAPSCRAGTERRESRNPSSERCPFGLFEAWVTDMKLHLMDRIHFGHSAFAHSPRSEEHTSELQSLMRISYAVSCLKQNNRSHTHQITHTSEP